MLRSINIGVVEASIAHELSEEASISSHTGDADAHVSVDLEDLLLMHSQVMWALFQSNQDLYEISWLTSRETPERSDEFVIRYLRRESQI